MGLPEGEDEAEGLSHPCPRSHVPLARACRKEPEHLCPSSGSALTGAAFAYLRLFGHSLSAGERQRRKQLQTLVRKYFCPKVGQEYKSPPLPLSVGLCALTFATSAYSAAFETLPKAAASPSQRAGVGNSLSRDVLPPSAQLGNLIRLHLGEAKAPGMAFF